jgi:hypothetical protein
MRSKITRGLWASVLTLIFGFAMLGVHSAWAESKHRCFPLAPPGVRSMVFTPTAVISEGERQTIFQRFQAIFAQEISSHGGRLELNEKEDMDFAAFAWRSPTGAFAVEMNKGVRYHKLITKDIYAMIACHEMGHHLGGLPLKKESAWAAVEGEADYFANLKCMRRYFEILPTMEQLAVPQPPDLTDRCRSSFQQDIEVRACIYSLHTARQLGAILYDLEGLRGAQPSFDVPDSTIALETLDMHPSTQCRLDTFRAGALCSVPWAENLSFNDRSEGACNPRRQPEQSRPTCWFNDGAVVIPSGT